MENNIKVVWKGKIVDILRTKKVYSIVYYKKKKLDVKNTELIFVGNADKIKNHIFALYKGKKVFVIKLYRKSAIVRPKPPYNKEIRVLISDLIVYNIPKISYNLFLENLLKIVIYLHYDIFKKNFSQKQLEKLKKTKIEYGQKTYRKCGHYCYVSNQIRINNHSELCIEEFFNKEYIRICKTIYHEILHIKYKDHLDGMFHHLLKQFREEEVKKEIKKILI